MRSPSRTWCGHARTRSCFSPCLPLRCASQRAPLLACVRFTVERQLDPRSWWKLRQVSALRSALTGRLPTGSRAAVYDARRRRRRAPQHPEPGNGGRAFPLARCDGNAPGI